MRTIFSRDENLAHLEPHDFKGWTALPTVLTTEADGSGVSSRPATFDDLDGELPEGTAMGAPYLPALIHWTGEGEQVIRPFAIKFDEKRDCQEFIADHLIGTNFYPTESFD